MRSVLLRSSSNRKIALKVEFETLMVPFGNVMKDDMSVLGGVRMECLAGRISRFSTLTQLPTCGRGSFRILINNEKPLRFCLSCARTVLFWLPSSFQCVA